MTKKRRLSDLYVTGKEVVFDDGQGEPVTLFMRKLNSLEVETALRNANKARALYHLATKDAESPEYMTMVFNHIKEIDNKEGMVDLVAAFRTADISLAAEAEISAEEEWAKDGYLQGLLDRWEELKTEDLDENEEARRVLDELERFNAAVTKRVDKERADVKEHLATLPMERLQQEYMELQFNHEEGKRWLMEFRFSEIWLACRVSREDRSRYFESREELDELDSTVLKRLLDEYAELSVEPQEGKGSRQTQGSSASSEPLVTEEISEVSGLVGVGL